jgi:type IX secretion system PorP/SprF family membrane protein
VLIWLQKRQKLPILQIFYMKKILFAFFILLFLGKLKAQDQHFTQFYASPLLLNPALTGNIEGKYRISSIYRSQWQHVLDEPLKTASFAADLRFRTPSRNRTSKDQIGVGFVFYNDKTGVLDFSTTQFIFSAAYHKCLDVAGKQFLSAGIQYGLSQRNVNYNSLTFHDEFNGLTGYTIPTEEILPDNNFSFNDFSAGLNYSGSFDNDFGLFAGVSLHHFLSPSVSYYGNSGEGERLYPKISGQLATSIPVADRISLTPRALVAFQGPHLEINAGTNVKIKFGEYGGYAWQIGTWARPVKFNTGMGLDALVLMTGVEIGSSFLGLSYDLNLTSAAKYGRRQGAFEISLTYLGEYENEEILCPKF